MRLTRCFSAVAELLVFSRPILRANNLVGLLAKLTNCALYDNKKLSYRRETARQLPTSWGGGPPVNSPSLWLHLPGGPKEVITLF